MNKLLVNLIYEAKNLFRNKYDQDSLCSCTTEDQFLKLDLSLFAELNSIIRNLGFLVPESGKWNIEQAVIGSHLVRVYKLNCLFLEQAKKGRLEICYLLSRLTGEAIINLRFLIKNRSEMIRPYVACSLKSENSLKKLIEKNIAKRGKNLPIEDRMLSSINFDFKYSGVQPGDIAQLADKWEYKKAKSKRTLKDRFDDIGESYDKYLAIFRLPSHAVHGDWVDSLKFNLNVFEGGEFTPNLDWSRLRPQLIESLINILCDGCAEYLKYLDIGNNKIFYIQLTQIKARVSLVQRFHEQFLSKSS